MGRAGRFPNRLYGETGRWGWIPVAFARITHMPTVVSTSGESGKEGEPPVVAGSPRYHTIDSLLHVIHDAITDEADQLDVSYDGKGFREFTSERVETENTHGTGCTFASAIAAGLAKGMELAAAVESAKEYVTQGLRHSYGVGGGHGPLNHFWGMG